MANKLTIALPSRVPSADLLNAGMYGPAAVVRVQTATEQAGTFVDLSGSGATPTVAIVEGSESYTAYDPSGGSTSWYQARYESSDGSRLSEWSQAVSP